MIAATWAWAGTSKFFDLSAFRGTIEAHGLFPMSLLRASPAIPAIELITAVLLLAFTDWSRARWALAWSFCLLAVLTVYLTQVPEPLRRAVGCGCGLRGLASSEHGASWPWISNAAFAAMHLLTGIAERFGPIRATARPHRRDACATEAERPPRRAG
ncbi:MAG: MauE/DoxX family redox-associated membrane protein [Phycisphaerales bacterium]